MTVSQLLFGHFFRFKQLFCYDKDHKCDNKEGNQFPQKAPQLSTIGPISSVAVLQAPPGIKV
ncbi:hypothetical protein EO92_09775 [Methanosarcina sp. 2.H.A.1B.4]|nr:hypothetical protein EO92_09775 [Methanosarcina sp. 2.H.A.1B.4]